MIRQSGVRRSQEARSAETRTRLLDATIECLLRYGYAGTTTPRVAELAGVTRGAQAHHFGSKDELMLAALQHLTAKRISTEVARFSMDFAASDDPIDAILQLLWDIHSAPIFIPIVELWVAGRTNSDLGREVAKFESVATSTLMSVIAEFAPEGIHRSMADFVYTAMDALRGILISSFVDSDPTRARRRWERATVNLRRIVDPAIADWAVTQTAL
ncbi:TetR/AcrR family transcriptional regulator [Mycolicibacterium mengxianglii]|uniref:TetR/AcrR family transcriptional regulator n=1 Tax=Mycolicibacterium mengxianglii TaxID=2736649 RepID=UPI001E53968C|nr:TetR/AcrR family transcriptional regulator [Mycolicibacterium mengxianglii]